MRNSWKAAHEAAVDNSRRKRGEPPLRKAAIAEATATTGVRRTFTLAEAFEHRHGKIRMQVRPPEPDRSDDPPPEAA